jgi:DNA-binding transcriptional MerR regulator
MEGFTAAQACSYTGCTPHQLRYWDRIGLVRPSIQATGGRPGVRRLYDFRDLVSLKVVASLLEKGMSLQRVRRAYDYLRRKAQLDIHFSEVKLVSDGQSIFQLYRNDGELIDLLREGQLAFYLAIDSAADSQPGRNAAHLYDREDFIKVLHDVEAEVSQQLPPKARERVYQSKAAV